MNNILFQALLILLLAGCTAQKTNSPTKPIMPSASFTAVIIRTSLSTILPATPTPSVQPVFSPTPKLSRTPTIISSPTQKPKSTATPDISITATIPLTTVAQCPEENPELVPDFVTMRKEYYPDIKEPILDFLNDGGTSQAIIDAFKAAIIDDPVYNDQHFLATDLTGDSKPELVIGYGNLYIFGCIQSTYQALVKVRTDLANMSDVDPWIETVSDLNLDGTPEIVITSIFAPFTWVRIFEWDGVVFQNLIAEGPDTAPSDENIASLIGAQASFLDIDGNGTLELILKGGIPDSMFVYYDGYPWRNETKIYQWNGEVFGFIRHEFDPPEFRFQAVQDGDRASLAGEYDQALIFYREAIFNDKLEWWSQARKDFEFACSMTPDCPTPTPPAPAPDPNEYYNLAGYARYRIMLLHILRGYLPEAQIVYETLQSKFPPGQAGHAFAELATIFWNEYQNSLEIGRACRAVTQYVKAHPVDILAYLGNGKYSDTYYGEQSLFYQPEDVCPFK